MRDVGGVPPTDYRLLATDLAGRCTLGLAFAMFSSFLRLISGLATFPTQQIASRPRGVLVVSRLLTTAYWLLT